MVENIRVVLLDQEMNELEHDQANIAQAIQSLLDMLQTLDTFPMGFSELKLPPHQLAQLVMEHMPDPDSRKMEQDERVYWMKVADHMGPDWIQALRKVAAYMYKIESF